MELDPKWRQYLLRVDLNNLILNQCRPRMDQLHVRRNRHPENLGANRSGGEISDGKDTPSA